MQGCTAPVVGETPRAGSPRRLGAATAAGTVAAAVPVKAAPATSGRFDSAAGQPPALLLVRVCGGARGRGPAPRASALHRREEAGPRASVKPSNSDQSRGESISPHAPRALTNPGGMCPSPSQLWFGCETYLWSFGVRRMYRPSLLPVPCNYARRLLGFRVATCCKAACAG